MLFNSFEFLIFLPLILISYQLIDKKWRWVLLLSASYIFYMWWEPIYIILIAGSTLIDHWCSKKISQTESLKIKKTYLLVSLFINLGLLFTFKYFNFIIDNINTFSHLIHINHHLKSHPLLLPVGISFYTFQTLSYTIDVYKKRIQPEKHLGYFSLFVSFFPQLVAGPIERSSNLLPQLRNLKNININNFKSGTKLLLWGMFKKVVIADRLAVFVNSTYNNPVDHDGLTLLIATIFFAFQIYCDFSGYSDIAIGVARMFGIKLMKNFDTPYFANSLNNFWSKWHISLSTWFRDYLYIPLGGNKVIKWRWYYNLYITFLISGIWHGAAWTFVIWGSIHGLFLLIEKRCTMILHPYKRTVIFNLIGFIITQTIVLLSWVFFRANSVSEARIILYKIVLLKPSTQFLYITNNYLITTSFLVILFLLLMEIIQKRFDLVTKISQIPLIFKYFIYMSLALTIITFGIFKNTEFIYFQF